MIINLNDVIAAIEGTTTDQEFCCNTLTGEIVFREEAGDEDFWIDLPTRKEIDDYGNMLSFIERKTSGEAKVWLNNAVHGRGAFRMFRATLERFDLLQQWYDYQDRMHKATAIDWCEYYGLEYNTASPVYDDDEEDDEYDEEEPEEIIMPEPKRQPLRYVNISKDNIAGVIYMVDQYLGDASDLEAAQEHIGQYLKAGYTITAVSDQGRFIAYSLNRDNELLELYVRPEHRRKGIGSGLLKEIEKETGSLIISLFPGNQEAMAFMKANGYCTLRAVTLVRDESGNAECRIGEQTLNY